MSSVLTRHTHALLQVVDQDKQVDAVHDEAHQAHDNVTRVWPNNDHQCPDQRVQPLTRDICVILLLLRLQGNEQLSEASQESFFARFFVLIFLIVASALLLFMDWYR